MPYKVFKKSAQFNLSTGITRLFLCANQHDNDRMSDDKLRTSGSMERNRQS